MHTQGTNADFQCHLKNEFSLNGDTMYPWIFRVLCNRIWGTAVYFALGLGTLCTGTVYSEEKPDWILLAAH